MTPIKWIRKDGDWIIRYGLGQFLIAQGAGWSSDVGFALYTLLKNTRPKVPRPVRPNLRRKDRS
jgi:hypothetical protein